MPTFTHVMRLRSLSLATLAGVLMVMGFQQTAIAETGSFIDDDNSRYEAFIETARHEGIVFGCNPPENDRFCPNDPVTRANMAIMLARAIGAQHADGDHFVDDDGHYAEGAIEALIGSGVEMGCAVDRFCPDRLIKRGEMATLISRALRWDHRASPDDYLDLGDSPFGPALAELASRGGIEACDAPADQSLCPRHTVKRDEAVFSLVSALGIEPTDVTTEIPDPPSIDFGDSFDALSLWDGRSPSYRNRVQLSDAGFRASALEVAIPKGSHFGADFRLDFSRTIDDEPEQVFFRYFLKLDRDWATTSSGKLPGFSGVYGRSGKGGYQSEPWEPGWSARLMFSPNTEDDPRVSLGYYVYHLGQGSRYGDKLHWNESGRLLPGDWYCLEGEVELNTLGLADGALRAWVDGTPAFDATGLEFRRPSEPAIRIESFWFNVYYGGKAVAERDLGLTIDEVVVDTTRIGCEVGDGTSSQTMGDFDDDGYGDRLWWSTCPGGNCFWMQSTSASGDTTTHQMGNGAWFSLESHRLGVTAGDVDGSGTPDVMYRGRCAGSERCWRVHRGTERGLDAGRHWGDGARFSPSTATLTLGDWNGDGLDDLVYQGKCGDDAHACWRMHPSNGSGFDKPSDWGATPQTPVFPVAADMTGDGLDDLFYHAPCDPGICWFVQASTGTAFDNPHILGVARESELEQHDVFDFDDDGKADLVSWHSEGERSKVEVRLTGSQWLTAPVLLTELEAEVTDVRLRRVEVGSPVQALVSVACSERQSCVEYMIAPSSDRLVSPDGFRNARSTRYGTPVIA